MSFETYEESRSRGEPVDIYLFRYGDTDAAYFAYTDAEEPVTVDGIIYQPTPIKRAGISASGTLDKSTLEVRTPQNVDLAELFRLYPPSQVITLVIRQGHIGDPDNQFLAIWSGRVMGCKRERNEAVYTGEPVSTSLKRTGLRRHYQYGCPHVLYGPQCKAQKDLATLTTQVLLVAGPRITLHADWETTDRKPKYLGGIVQWTSTTGVRELRTILRVEDGNVLLMTGIAKGLVAPSYVNVILGCNHQLDDCEFLHSNIYNFGGQPWIPTDNPIGIKNIYY